ncbi:WYL domain-containing protein [candidate division KSB1 bacterium]|nr:WYL domain-containing protein [candidate division KSB1 bacterium]
MKIDRLLSIIIILLNRERITARELGERFRVSVRTIQRDMDTLCAAGIPIRSEQGAQGGFGIISDYRFDRQLVDSDDLYYILTALEGISLASNNTQISNTLEKIKTLVRDVHVKEFEKKKERLYIDFSDLSGIKHNPAVFKLVHQCIDESCLIGFSYTDSGYHSSQRTIEPMTLVFKWYSWYVYGYCRLREDYRLFRISRMHDVKMLPERFHRREKVFHPPDEKELLQEDKHIINIKLRFDSEVRRVVREYFQDHPMTVDAQGRLIVEIRLPANEWLYGLILSYGDKVQVLEPASLATLIAERVQKIAEKYSFP